MMLTVACLLLFLMSSVPAGQTVKCPAVCVCDNTKLTVTCVGKNLTHVPPTINEITVKLDLKRNNFRELAKSSFKHTPYLTHLNLQGCSVQSVREGAFRGLSRLVLLDLTNNNIDILYQESFDGLASLKQLYLDRNRIEEIHPGAFAALNSLNLLSLTHNQLVYLPNMAFQGMLNIQLLRLSYNSLNNLATEAFAGLLALTHLNLDHNELQYFPTKTMTRLVELTHLDLSFNPMTYLVEESVSMPKLTHLSLNHMALQDLSESALSLSPFISQVELSYNQLPYIQALSGPSRLTGLNLTGNPIRCTCLLQGLKTWALNSGIKLYGACAWPPHLSDEPLENVQEQDLRCRPQDELMLDVTEKEGNEEDGVREKTVPTAKPKKKSKCPINCQCEAAAQHATCEHRGHTKVPTGFAGNTLLLDMRGNHFHYLPSKSFPGIPKVVSLHLDGCKIHEIEGGAFQGMKGLMYLYLSDNQLSSLDAKAFEGAHEIMYLHLEGNKLTQFPSSAALAHIPKLLELHLERNLIAKLEPSGLLSTVPQLTGLYLNNNTIATIVPKALDPAPKLDLLHLGANVLTEVPSDALGHAPLLTEIRLSGNPIRWIGPKAFRAVAESLKHLYIDKMGIQKMSVRSLAGFGPGLLSLSLEGNQLEELPDLSPLTGLQNLALNKNPLMCDCKLLPFYRWLENVSLKVEAVCGYPPELRGQSVLEAVIFKNCSKENNHSFNETSIPTTAPKPNKPKPMKIKAKARPISSEPNPKPAKTKLTAAPKKKESNELKPLQALKTTRPNKKKRGRQPRIKLSRK
ncbi:chondroadherin-like protein [Rhinichthys klamathensis goyatoka]|uniref:chondroadherin-like protein n=1 Tax=Rhinichthys klamathensis goyatoka TaxID=3034132 RepID=UPI0024B4C441|nr:chondroadherin-like protein [Rhinichthys klamathensis goyatoka]